MTFQEAGDERNKDICISIVMPSRLMADTGVPDTYFLESAIASVRSQKCGEPVDFRFIVGVDIGTPIPPRLSAIPDVRFVHSSGHSQVLALNAAIEQIEDRSSYVGFLEDDDRWHPDFLFWFLRALRSFQFVSTTQLEVNEKDRTLYVSDFPTPSGWLMPLSTLRAVGPFNAEFKWHLDNQWLGRLADSGMSRCHLVEATAPTTIRSAIYRPGIMEVIENGGANMHILRHGLTTPLVKRLVHTGSGMHHIAQGGRAARESELEYKVLIKQYGHIPW